MRSSHIMSSNVLCARSHNRNCSSSAYFQVYNLHFFLQFYTPQKTECALLNTQQMRSFSNISTWTSGAYNTVGRTIHREIRYLYKTLFFYKWVVILFCFFLCFFRIRGKPAIFRGPKYLNFLFCGLLGLGGAPQRLEMKDCAQDLEKSIFRVYSADNDKTPLWRDMENQINISKNWYDNLIERCRNERTVT